MHMSDVDDKFPKLKLIQAPDNPWVLMTDPEDWKKGELEMFHELHDIFQKQMTDEMKKYKATTPKKYLIANEVIFLRLNKNRIIKCLRFCIQGTRTCGTPRNPMALKGQASDRKIWSLGSSIATATGSTLTFSGFSTE
jgi:hypothetical protein